MVEVLSIKVENASRLSILEIIRSEVNMIHWVWLIYAFVGGVVITVLCIRKIVTYIALLDLGRTSSWLKRMHDATEALRLAKLEKSEHNKRTK